MSPLKVWFPEFYTEAHRNSHEGAALVTALNRYGVECYWSYQDDIDLVFCGSFFHFTTVQERRQKWKKPVPIVHYVWDMYPFQINGEYGRTNYDDRWQRYLIEVRTFCNLFIVPSKCTVERVREFTGKDAVVVKSSVRSFSEPLWDGDYVLDAMRNYPDPNVGVVSKACSELGIPCLRSDNKLSWEEYKQAVAGCRFIVSGQYEASTGGLSALEAYALGKPVLLSNSPRHGGVDYFGERALYFQWDDFKDLKRQIKRLWDANLTEGYMDGVEQRHWVMTEYSEDRMAMELAQHLRRVAGLPERTFSLRKHVEPYHATDFINNEHGYIVWRIGTGDNLEILHIRAKEEGHGNGRALIKDMLKRIQETGDEPFHSVFVFTKASNSRAIEFYRSLEMSMFAVPGLYQELAALFTIPYTDLARNVQYNIIW